MDFECVCSLAEAENLELGGDADLLLEGLKEWYASLFEVFGDLLIESECCGCGGERHE